MEDEYFVADIKKFGNDLKCPDCGRGMRLLKGKFGWFYACVRYPWACKGSHSAHQETKEPMGFPADKETRIWRRKAHKVFDGYWKKWKIERERAYLQLRKVMNIPKEYAHISMFDIVQCQKVIDIFKNKRPGDLMSKKKKKMLLKRKEFSMKNTKIFKE